MADTPVLELQIRDNSDRAIQGLQRLASSLNDLRASLTGGIGLERISESLTRLAQRFESTFSDETVNRINRVSDALERIANAGNARLPDISRFGEDVNRAASQLNMQPVTSEVAEVGSAINNAAPALNNFAGQAGAVTSAVGEIAESVGEATRETENLGRGARNAGDACREHAHTMNDFRETVSRLISPLDRIINRFNRLLTMRILRNVIKQIGKAFKEGITNVRAYSKAIDGSFNKAMTGAEDALLKMKNSLGAALAPALEALIPVMHTVVNWFIELVNYVNQFISLLTGKATWTRAIDASAAEFEKTKKTVVKADKEVKNLLADFDELNIIQREPSGSGGSGGKVDTTDYTTMFEEVGQFDGKLKEIVGWLKDNMGEVKKIAGLIGSALLGWRFASSFTGPLAQFASLLALGATIALTWKLVTLFDGKYLESKDIGWLVADVLTTALGAFATRSLITSVLGTNYGYIAAGITLAVSATATMKAVIGNVDTSVLSKESVAGFLVAAVKYGAAGVFLARTFSGLGAHVHHFSRSELVAIGGGVALATFGAGVGIKATVQSIESDETEETLSAKAIGSLSMGAAAGLIGSKLFKLDTIDTVKFSAGIALVSFGVFTGIKAFADALQSGVTEEELMGYAVSSLSAGIGAGLIGSKIFNLSAGDTVLTSAGAAFLIFGAFTGVQAVADYIASGETDETLAGYAVSSLSAGLSAGLIGSKLFKLEAFDAAKVGIGSAFAVFAAFMAIQAFAGAIVSGITKEDIFNFAKTSLSAGLGAGFLGSKLFNLEGFDVAKVGIGSALAVFAAFTGIQAVADYVESGETAETLAEYAVSSLSAGLSAGFLGSKLFNLEGFDVAKVGIGSALAVFAAFTAIQAFADAVESGVTEQDILDFAVTSVSAGLSAGFLGSKLFNLEGFDVAKVGVGSALAVFAVFTGIQAVANYIDSGETDETIAGYAVSSLSAGLSAGLIGSKLFKLEGFDAAKVGIGSAFAVFAAFTAIKAFAGAVVSGITKQDILDFAKTSLSAGLGAGFIGSKLFNLEPGQSLSAGMGTALVVFGAFTAIQAVADSIAGEDTDKTIMEYAAASLSLGAGITQLLSTSKLFNLSAGDKVLTGIGNALLIFGAFTGVQAYASAIDAGFTRDNLVQILESSLSMGAGAGLIGSKLFHLDTIKSMEFASGMAALVVGGYVGVTAFSNAVKGQATEKDVGSALFSSLLLGLAGTSIGNSLFKMDIFRSLKLGGGTAAIIAGAYVGITAVTKAVKNDEITTGTIAQAALSSLGVGFGSAMLAMAFGASAGVAGIVGGIAGVATVAAIVGVTVILRSTKSDLRWGTVSLSDEDVKDFVEKSLFKGIPVNAAIEIIGAKVTASDEQKLNVQKQVEEVFAEYNKIQAGIDVKNSYEKMKTQLFGSGENADGGLIGMVQQYAEGQTSLLTTSFSLIPIITDAGKDVSKEYLKSGISGWQGLSTYVTDLGTNISDLLKNAITDGLDDLEQQMLDSLMSQLTNVTRAMTEAQISTGAYTDLGIKLGDLDKGSFYKAVDYYIEYRDQLYTSYHQMYKKELESFAGLVSGYSTSAENERKYAELYEKGSEEYNKHIEAAKKYEEIAQGFKTQYEELLGSYEEKVNGAVEKQAAAGKELILQTMLKVFDPSTYSFDKLFKSQNFSAYLSKGDYSGALQTVWTQIARELGTTPEKIMQLGFSLDDFIPKEQKQGIIEWLEKSYKRYPEQVHEFLQTIGWELPNIDDSGLTEGLEETEKGVKSSTDNIFDDIKRLDGMQITYAPTISAFGGRGITLTAKFNMMAEGGFVSTGDMFIAREAGPELVGRIGNRTAVANNDQIVSGVANGVAAGQSEQNYLLRQQNEYLRAILAKESTVRVEPSAGWGRFNRQSEQMYARNAGG